MDGHFGFDLKAARQHRICLDEGEREGPIAGHNVGDMRVEQAVDRTAHQAVAEVVEGPLVFLEVRGAQAVADHHIVAFEDFVHHGRRGVGGVRIVSVGHDVHVSINVFEHGSNDVTLALAWFLTHDSAFCGGDFRCAIGGVVVVDVNGCIRQSSLKITNDLADGHFFVIAGKQHGNGGVGVLFEHAKHYSRCCGRSETSCGFNYGCCLLGKGYERMA